MAQEGELPEEQVIIIKNKNVILPEVAKPQEKVTLTLKPLPQVKQKYSYKDFSLVLPLLDPKLKAPVSRNEPAPDVKQGFVRLAGGNYGSTLADLYYNSGRTKDYAYGAYLNHLASAKGPVDNSGFSRNAVGAYGKYFTPSFTLSGGLDYGRSRYNFYGYDMERFKNRPADSVRQVFQSILFQLKLEKAKNIKKFRYSAGMGLGNISDRFKASESEILFNLNGDYRLKDSSSVTVFTDLSLAKREDSASQSRALWRLEPTYHFGWKGFHVDAGFQFSVDNEPELKEGKYSSKTRMHFHPRLHLQQNIMQTSIVGFAGISGGMNKRTLRTSLEANPFLAPNVYLRQENQLFNLYFGLKGQWTGQLQYRSQISFETLENQAFFVANVAEREKYHLVYSEKNTTRFTWETEVVYDLSEETRAGARFAFYSYGMRSSETVKEPWHAPHSLVSLFARQQLNKNLMLSGEFYYMGGIKALNPETAETEKLKGMADLNLKGEYLFLKRYTAFVSAHNILNNKNQRYLFYPTQGFRIMVGATATF